MAAALGTATATATATPAAAPTGAPPQGDGNNLARALAVVAALAASLFAPAVFTDPEQRGWYWQAIAALALGAALLALSTRLPRARTLRTLLVAGYVSWIIGSAAVPLLLVGAYSVWTHEGQAVAAAAAASWLLAVGLNRWEARRAFRTARRLEQLRGAAFLVAMAVWMPVAGGRLYAAIDALLQPRWQGTVAEGLAAGTAAVVAGAFVLVGLVLASWLPGALLRAQQRGLLGISAGSETLWFTALVAVGLPLALAALPGVTALQAFAGPSWAPDAPLRWGDVGLRVLAVALAHGATRLLLGRAGLAAPVPLIVLLPTPVPSAATQQFLARLPAAWGAGPVTRIALPEVALRDSGTHAAGLARIGQTGLLFPTRRADFEAWRVALPPPGLWRALPVREAYVEPAFWSNALPRWLTPDTRVLWLGAPVPDPQSAFERFAAEAVLDALPPGRSVTVDLSGLPTDLSVDDAQGLARLPAWQGRDADTFCTWLRERVRPTPARRVLLLHTPAEAALADRLAERLSGQHDAEGRFVEAAALGNADLWRLLGMPLWVVQLGLASVRAHLAQQPQARSWWLTQAERVARAMLPRGERDIDEHDVLLLCGAPTGSPRWFDTPGSDAGPLVAAARSRLALVLHPQAEIPPSVQARIDATGLHDGEDAAALERVAAQWLARRWVRTGSGAAPSGTPSVSPPVPGSAPESVPASSPQPVLPSAQSTPTAAAPDIDADAAVPTGVPEGLLLVDFGLAESRRKTVHALLQQRLAHAMPVSLHAGGSLTALVLAGHARTQALLVLTAAQAPGSRASLQGLAASAHTVGVRVWQAPTAAPAAMAMGDLVPRLPADWDPDDPVPGPNLPAWTDALAAELLQYLPRDAAAPRDDRVTCLARRHRLAGSEAELLIVGRTSGALRVGAALRPGWHRGPVRALLAMGDGRVASVGEGEIQVLGDGEQAQRLFPSTSVTALAEVLEEGGRRSLVTVGHSSLQLLPMDVEGRPLELALPASGLDVVGFDLQGYPGWVAVAAGTEGVLLIDPRRGSIVRANNGRFAYTVRRVAAHDSRVFFAAVDTLGQGVVGVHTSGLREARPVTLDGWRAPVSALWPLSENELLFGDDAGGLWRWRPEQGARPEPVTQIAGAIDAIVRTQDGAVTLLSRGRLVGAGLVKA